MNTQLLIQLLVNGVVIGTLYGVVAMSFVLIYKATQVVNFAQGELLLVGAWVCWWLLTKYQVPFYLGMPITLVFIMLGSVNNTALSGSNYPQTPGWNTGGSGSIGYSSATNLITMNIPGPITPPGSAPSCTRPSRRMAATSPSGSICR